MWGSCFLWFCILPVELCPAHSGTSTNVCGKKEWMNPKKRSRETGLSQTYWFMGPIMNHLWPPCYDFTQRNVKGKLFSSPWTFALTQRQWGFHSPPNLGNVGENISDFFPPFPWCSPRDETASSVDESWHLVAILLVSGWLILPPEEKTPLSFPLSPSWITPAAPLGTPVII